jgi:Concanavalin A-like lectin/glucanases superfamily
MRLRAAWWTIAVLGLGACAPKGGPANVTARLQPPPPDSVTVALWRMDETGGVRVMDSGLFRLSGTAGVDTRTDFGRFGNARVFTRSLDSFVFVPANPVFDFGGSFTIEAWVYLNEYSLFDAAPIIARWSPAVNEQSWFLGVAGYHQGSSLAGSGSAALGNIAGSGQPGQLIFAFQTLDAGPPRVYTSTRAIERARWTHVAASYDGSVVRLYLDGQLDAQSATTGRVRPSAAPLIMGNFFDERWLGTFGGDLRIEQALDSTPYFALEGLLDEVRLSSTARSSFPQAEWR